VIHLKRRTLKIALTFDSEEVFRNFLDVKTPWVPSDRITKTHMKNSLIWNDLQHFKKVATFLCHRKIMGANIKSQSIQKSVPTRNLGVEQKFVLNYSTSAPMCFSYPVNMLKFSASLNYWNFLSNAKIRRDIKISGWHRFLDGLWFYVGTHDFSVTQKSGNFFKML